MHVDRTELLNRIILAIVEARADAINEPEGLVSQALTARVLWESFKAKHHLLLFLKNR